MFRRFGKKVPPTALVVAIFLTIEVVAQPIKPPPGADDQPADAHYFQLRQPFDELVNVRDNLEKKGISIHIFFNDQYQAVAVGGLDTNGWGRNSASLDAFVTLDLGKLCVIPDAEVLLHLQSNWGNGINGRTGSLFQVNDDADGDLGLHVAQLWYRQHFLDHRASLALGFLDFQTILDRNTFANSEDKQFMNQALDNNPLVPLNIGLGANLALKPFDWYTLNIGVGDAQSVLYKPGFSTALHDENWWIAYVEQTVTVAVPSRRGPLEGNYRTGMIYDPRPRTDSTSPKDRETMKGHDYGLYISVDQEIYRESPEDDQGLGIFGRFAYRTPETNQFSRFWSGGVEYKGPIPSRDRDVLGLAFALQRVSDSYRRHRGPPFDQETIYELYYAIQVSPNVVFTLDSQYLDNPGGDHSESSAVVVGLRLRVSL
jgi:carbohydrate-selective porin OprB